jgi:phosphoinositide-3-kinase regulatory subunit 4
MINLTDRFTQEDDNDETTVAALQALNNPRDGNFDPTVFALWDLKDMSGTVKWMLRPYIQWAQQAVRHPTDVIMLTHLILYFSTSVPSAIYLFKEFTWLHGVAHWIMQSYYVGTYTLMKHQHIHMGGVLAKRFPYNYIDVLFPYITDPLMGHTWNSYYYHHVKHHHVEGNGPDDLSLTIRYQRDDIFHLLHYVVKFLFFIWLDLPLYFIRKRKFDQAFKAAFWEVINFIANILLARWKFRSTLFVFILPLLLLRLGLMVGNWGQHAFIDDTEPDSDYRSSITLIDVAVSSFTSILYGVGSANALTEYLE